MEEKDGRALIKTSRGYPSSSGLSSSSDLFFFLLGGSSTFEWRKVKGVGDDRE